MLNCNTPIIFDEKLLDIHNKFISDLYESKIFESHITYESFCNLLSIIDETILNIIEHFMLKLYYYKSNILMLYNVHNTLRIMPVMVDKITLDIFGQIVDSLKQKDNLDMLIEIRDKLETIPMNDIISNTFVFNLIECVDYLIVLLQSNEEKIAELSEEINWLKSNKHKTSQSNKDAIAKLTAEIKRLKSLSIRFSCNDATMMTLS
jgi:uncharacterized small protein (DUF1192 family)